MSDNVVKRMAELGMEDSRKDSNDSVFSSPVEGYKKRFSLGLSLANINTGGQCVATGIVYDDDMMYHENDINDGHPECPERISCIWKKLTEQGIVTCCKRIEARKATQEEILLVHKKTHYDIMISTEDMPIEKLFYLALQYTSIYMNKYSISCALLAAGSVCEVTKKVLLGDLDNGLAIVRPPGHHAESYKPMGFCFFNNVAIAAKMAVEKFGTQRVLIVDWDVHHGNGTQSLFYDDKRVLYISLHRYDNGRFFPSSDDADYDKCGSGQGEGYNINIPWNKATMGDAEYLAAFHQIIMPVAYEYNPELVLISCGFDSGEGDPLGGYDVTPPCYGHMTHMLKALANGKLVVALEGGYNLSTISNSMCHVAEVLLGDSPRGLETACVPNASAMNTIKNVCIHISSYWKSLSHWSQQGYTTSIPETPAALTEDSILENEQVSDTPTSFDNEQVKSKPQEDNHIKDNELVNSFGRTDGSTNPIPNLETPPLGSIPVSSERMPLSMAQKTIIETLENEGSVCMFAVSPKAWCHHLESIVPLSSDNNIDTKAVCEVCQTPRENWVCLTCNKVLCGRYINQHMVQHNEETGHCIALSYADLSVWCFPCDSYIHNPVLLPYINKAHVDKFGSS